MRVKRLVDDRHDVERPRCRGLVGHAQFPIGVGERAVHHAKPVCGLAVRDHAINHGFSHLSNVIF
jgi:hypothetical protein